MQEGVEACDDGDDDDDDGCDSQCVAHNHPQCTMPYTTFDKGDRNKNSGGGSFCDRQDALNPEGWSGPGWYRFSGPAGTQMSEAAISVEHCGTYSSGWLNSPHPALGDGIVDLQVCFSWKDESCHFATMIQVVACTDFYLYQLPDAPGCDLRYCGEN